MMKRIPFGIQSFLFWIAAKSAGLWKMSFIVGSYSAFFSAANCVVPLSGAFLGLRGSTIMLVLTTLVRMFLYGSLFPLSYCVHIVPGFFAAWYWASRSIMIRCFLPLLCMVLFVVHPVGIVAWPYVWCWLVPVLFYLMRTKLLFCEALGSTLIAHAVGSVIWLYTMPTTASLWYGLMPVVCIERICFAIGMTLLYKVIYLITHKHWSFFKQWGFYPV